MRKCLFILVLILAVGIVGCAKEAEARGDPCDSFLSSVLNECSPYNHEPTVDTNTQNKNPGSLYGVGADIVLWENETGKLDFIEEVVAEYKYEARYHDHSGYVVVRLNLWQKIKKFFTGE